MALTACGNDDPFRSPATISNVVTGVVVAPFSDATTAPAALDLVNLRAVRPEVSFIGAANFQLAFDADASGQLRLYPVNTLLSPPGGSAVVGLQRSESNFAALERAPSGGFVVDTAQTASIGETFIFRVTAGTCAFGDPLYGKLEIESYNAATRRATVRLLLNRNCGYRDLTEGLPTN